MVTADQVKAAATAAKLGFVPHHECSMCGVEVGHVIDRERLFFRSACGCTRYPSSLEPRGWQSITDEINMQDNEEWRGKLMARWGFGK